MGWQSYELDRIAQKLVLNAKAADPQSLNQSYKMRVAVSYGLERFWGEQFRLRSRNRDSDQKKADYWQTTWREFVAVMRTAGLSIPDSEVNLNNVGQIQAVSEDLWRLSLEEQRIAIAVLTQLCDCIVWWTQRYKGERTDGERTDDDSNS